MFIIIYLHIKFADVTKVIIPCRLQKLQSVKKCQELSEWVGQLYIK